MAPGRIQGIVVNKHYFPSEPRIQGIVVNKHDFPSEPRILPKEYCGTRWLGAFCNCAEIKAQRAKRSKLKAKVKNITFCFVLHDVCGPTPGEMREKWSK